LPAVARVYSSDPAPLGSEGVWATAVVQEGPQLPLNASHGAAAALPSRRTSWLAFCQGVQVMPLG
jgi:hypothetical protein